MADENLNLKKSEGGMNIQGNVPQEFLQALNQQNSGQQPEAPQSQLQKPNQSFGALREKNQTNTPSISKARQQPASPKTTKVED